MDMDVRPMDQWRSVRRCLGDLASRLGHGPYGSRHNGLVRLIGDTKWTY